MVGSLGAALIRGGIASALGLLGGLGVARALGGLVGAAGCGIPLAGMERISDLEQA